MTSNISSYKSNFCNVNIVAKRSAVNLKLTRSSLTEVFCEKLVLENFAKFTGKHLSLSLRLRPATLLKKRPWYRCFPVNFAKFSRTPFYKEHLQWLLRVY